MNDENLINKAYIHVQFDDIDEFKKLVPSQVDPNASNFSSQNHLHTFLQCAAAYGAEKCTQYLLNLENEEYYQEEFNNLNNEQNLEDPKDTTENVTENGNKLTSIKLHVDARKKNFAGFTALHWAAYSGRPETVKLLVDKGGADINSRNEDGLTPIHIAASRGHLQFIKYLVDNYQVRSADNPDFLLNVDLGAVTSDGWTAVHYALIGNHQPVVKYLVDEMKVECSELDVNMKSIHDVAKEYGRTWFHLPNEDQ